MSRRTSWEYYKHREDWDEQRDVPMRARCIRYKESLQAAFDQAPRPYWKRKSYQQWKKCLFKKNGVCRRCGGEKKEHPYEIHSAE